MTQAQVEKRLRHWQAVLNLNHWEISPKLVEIAGDDEDAAAAVIRSGDYDRAIIEIAKPHLQDNDAERQLDISICHELMHIHMRDLDSLIENLMFRQSSQDAANAMHPNWMHLREGLVDRIARVLVNNYS